MTSQPSFAPHTFAKILQKYNVPAPRYTSYPTVPYWETAAFTPEGWKERVRRAFQPGEGISLYIHLPYCESLCTYCGCNTRITKNHGVESPYIDTLLKEWGLYTELMAGKPLVSELHLGGGTPTFFSPESLRRLIEGIFKTAQLASNADLSIEVHPGSTTRVHLETLYEVGFRRISIGVQDFDPHILKVINRRQTLEQVEEVTHWAREIGFTSVNYDLVYGLPFQQSSNIIKNIALIQCLRPDRIAFYSYAHVPWVRPGQRAYSEADLPTGHEKRALYELGRELLEDNGFEEIGMDHFALPNDPLCEAKHTETLHRNFMGYTAKHTRLLVGLGASSISDTWTAFAQNEKKVEDYMAQIQREELAVAKGHLLTEEDQFLRQHILNIMCHGKTSWHPQDHQAFQPILKRLQPLMEDELLIVENERLQVLPLGEPFLRNICMAFDARLWQQKPETTIFSQAV